MTRLMDTTTAPVRSDAPAAESLDPVDVQPSSRKPLLASRRTRLQFGLAATMWTVAALILGFRGVGWLVGHPYALPLSGAALAVGAAKYWFVMAPVARRIGARILGRGPAANPLGFFSWRSWGVVALMVAAGHALRLTALPRVWLGALYVAVAVGLALGSRVFWRSVAVRD